MFYHLFHSFRVCFSIFSTRFERILGLVALQTTIKLPTIKANCGCKTESKIQLFRVYFSHLSNSLRVYFHIFPTRFECIFTSYPLVSSVFSHLINSFRVYFHIFPTRLECIPGRRYSSSMSDVSITLTTLRNSWLNYTRNEWRRC